VATLPTADRQRIWRALMRYLSSIQDPIALVKIDLQAAVDAADTWVNNNAGSFNSALPAAAQSGLTTGQKSLLLCAVVLMRYNLALLQALFGMVD
jgi:hypothetical protein